MDYTIKIGGSAGQGVQTIGGLLSTTFAGMGYHVFAHQDYESRVRGGHNFYQIRLADIPVASISERIDILIALDLASKELHASELTEDGVMAYDSESLKTSFNTPEALDVPFKSLSIEKAGSPQMANTVAVGTVMGMLGMDTDMLEVLIKKRFKRKGEEIVKGNINALQAGHAYALEHCRQCSIASAPPDQKNKKKLLIDGHESAAMGALASGLKFYAAYPMTPSTGVMDHIAARAGEFGVVVEQAEDEIAAINMAIGASFAGVRAATGSSGGGFALMVEGLSLAGITETPIVIFEAQRPGPATGLPTRTEQADLMFIIHTAHGEFPRVVFTPGSPEQMITLTNKAFDLAEKYQIPVFVVYDQYLGDSQWTYESFDTSVLRYKDYRVRGADARKITEYKRHAFTESGVSPLIIPGDGHEHLVVTDSDEHDEAGHLMEDPAMRISMVEKRLHKKLGAIRLEMAPPELYGSKEAKIVLAGWGSTYGVLRETVDKLNALNSEDEACMLFFSEIYPLPKGEYLEMLGNAQKTVCIEGNATGQLATLLRSEAGIEFTGRINKYDGRPFTVQYIIDRL